MPSLALPCLPLLGLAWQARSVIASLSSSSLAAGACHESGKRHEISGSKLSAFSQYSLGFFWIPKQKFLLLKYRQTIGVHFLCRSSCATKISALISQSIGIFCLSGATRKTAKISANYRHSLGILWAICPLLGLSEAPWIKCAAQLLLTMAIKSRRWQE